MSETIEIKYQAPTCAKPTAQKTTMALLLVALLGGCGGPPAGGQDLAVIEGAMIVTAPVWVPIRLVGEGVGAVRGHDEMAPETAAVCKGPDAIADFVKSGGQFTDQQDKSGETSGMMAVFKGPEIIRAYAKAGGTFTDVQNKYGITAAMIAAQKGTETIKAYAEAGGAFTDQQDNRGLTSAMMAASHGSEAITAFSDAGGIFTNQKDNQGKTAHDYVLGKSPGGYNMNAAQNAYEQALVRQHGLRNVEIKEGAKS